MSEKIKMKEDLTEVDRELAECSAKLVECSAKLVECSDKLAEGDRRLDDYKKKPSPGFESTIASLMIFSFGFLFGLGFTLPDKPVVDSLYYGGAE